MRPIKLNDFSNFKPDPKPERKPKPEKKPISKKRKPTGERELHLAIWAVRKHVSYFSGENLGDDPDPCFFMHVLPKSTYPKFRLEPVNIVLGTFDEHYAQTNFSRDKWDPKFRDKWENLERILKQKYQLL